MSGLIVLSTIPVRAEPLPQNKHSILLASGESGEELAKLLGRWESKTEFGVVSLVFESENQLVFDGESAQYTFSPGNIRVWESFVPIDYPYQFQGDDLVVSFPEGYKLQFKRLGASSPTEGEGTGKQSAEMTQVPGKSPVQAGMSDLVRHFTGTWVNFTSNTQTGIELSLTGEFAMNYEGSYSGIFENQYGDQTGHWGSAAQEGNRGRWAAQGNLERGVITLTYSDGSQEAVEYQVHVEKGYTYWNEYFFDGKLYSKKR
jgi:hypothetical protein